MGQAVVISKPTGRLSSSTRAAAATSSGSRRASGRAGAVWDVGRLAGVSMPWRAGGGGDRRTRRSRADGGGRCAEKMGSTAATGGVVVRQSVWPVLDVVAVTLGAATMSLCRLTTTSASGFTGSAAAAVATATAAGDVISVTYNETDTINEDTCLV